MRGETTSRVLSIGLRDTIFRENTTTTTTTKTIAIPTAPFSAFCIAVAVIFPYGSNAMSSNSAQSRLVATYSSPDNKHFTVTKTLDSPPSASPEDKTTYLEALRKAVTETQEQINKELTARMEEDVARGTATAQDKEEENYGEEVQEEED
ncbi:hypothetical protein E4U35_007166 [Claviceps purpurea]|uniref:EKC/KEOPS complex subunit GON7 n=1 Tax=Claviceps purpurea (strain 20.1) TaxID=1111077 RepID=M1W264_CLAP2|nr:hypothetical protein E4U28_003075 [Claviceps purpurea]CCE27380.1 uncharacterized protein CPUR_00854 [Claviceps purpurea 20.1]KAG6159250.1 hypothetical protein E4U37_004057 [Claviceps purpurea]KAG6209411.1 hypothetical protein E4U35_007166 [Claviceps purpurea]KAG6217741.1 hypothetical protein E4U50_003000 [Claviceps purpurea]